MHVYFPYKHNLKFKIFLILTLLGLLCGLIPLFVGLMANFVFGWNGWIAGGITAAIGLVIIILVACHSFTPKITSVIVDAKGLTIKSKNEDDKVYPINMYEGYSIAGKHRLLRLHFRNYEDEGEGQELVFIQFLPRSEKNKVVQDLETLKKHGVLPVYKDAKPANNNNNVKQIRQQVAEVEDLSKDPVKYDEYLSGVLARMSISDKSRIISLTTNGDNMLAIKECREKTGIGLKYARDLVEGYMTFPDLHNYRARIYMRDTTIDQASDLYREYGEIYTDNETIKNAASFQYIPGTTWVILDFTPGKECKVVPLFWDYINLVMWMTQRSGSIFAYAVSDKKKYQPIIAFPDRNDPNGETCYGVMYKSDFRFNMPEHQVSWGPDVTADFDVAGYISREIGEDIKSII